MGVFDSFFGGNKADKYLEKIPGTVKPYFDPYIESGQRALPTLEEQYMNLLRDPSALMSKIGSNFQADPGYQWDVNEMTRAANQAAAAGGMLGTPQNQQQVAQAISGLADKQYQNYLSRALGLYGTGLSGLGDINQRGYEASTNLSQILADNLTSRANSAYSRGINQYLGSMGGLGNWFGGGGGGGGGGGRWMQNLMGGAATIAPFFML